MPFRVAFDLDGVLADMESELVRQSAILFGEPLTGRTLGRADAGDLVATAEGSGAPGDGPDSPDDPPRDAQLNMTTRQRRRLWRHVQSIDNFWRGLPETEPGIVGRLATLAGERRWEIIFLTKRPETAGATAQLQTQRWLEEKGFALPSVFVVQGSRGRIAAALDLDVVIDDRPENCYDVIADSKARAILVWRGAESQLPATARQLGIGVAKSVAECLDILGKVESVTRDDPGMVARLMRLFGRKEPASM